MNSTFLRSNFVGRDPLSISFYFDKKSEISQNHRAMFADDVVPTAGKNSQCMKLGN